MNNCKCEGIEAVFNQAEADHKLREYRQKGPAASTRLLIEALTEAGVRDRTLLDVGGGVGSIQYALLKAGARAAVSVDASSAYLETAQAEAGRQGLRERIEYHQGDFVELAATLPSADIVTLDRVICCYADMPALVGQSASRARHLYGLVYPRDTWWIGLGVGVLNWLQQIRGAAFRGFVHPTQAVEAVLRDNGLERRFHRLSGVWQVAAFARS